jgi:hypothetical protein
MVENQVIEKRKADADRLLLSLLKGDSGDSSGETKQSPAPLPQPSHDSAEVLSLNTSMTGVDCFQDGPHLRNVTDGQSASDRRLKTTPTSSGATMGQGIEGTAVSQSALKITSPHHSGSTCIGPDFAKTFNSKGPPRHSQPRYGTTPTQAYGMPTMYPMTSMGGFNVSAAYPSTIAGHYIPPFGNQYVMPGYYLPPPNQQHIMPRDNGRQSS